jgi:hypothetical protein
MGGTVARIPERCFQLVVFVGGNDDGTFGRHILVIGRFQRCIFQRFAPCIAVLAPYQRQHTARSPPVRAPVPHAHIGHFAIDDDDGLKLPHAFQFRQRAIGNEVQIFERVWFCMMEFSDVASGILKRVQRHGALPLASSAPML